MHIVLKIVFACSKCSMNVSYYYFIFLSSSRSETQLTFLLI